MREQHAIDTLTDAYSMENPGSSLKVQTDHGAQFTSFRIAIKRLGSLMKRYVNQYDNAVRCFSKVA